MHQTKQELIEELEILKANMKKCVFCRNCREEMSEIMKLIPKGEGK